MSSPVPHCGWLLLALALPVCAASPDKTNDKAAAAPLNQPPPGFHDITINQGGGHKYTLRVPNEPKQQPEDASSSDGPYDPEHVQYNKPSSYANKTFSASDALLSKNDSALDSDKHFNTSSYATKVFTLPDHTFQTAAFKTNSKNANSFSKTFQLPGASADFSKSYDVKGSDMGSKKALLADTKEKADPFAAPDELTEKKFYDPMMTHVKRDSTAAASGLDVARLAKLPNRPLTIDEVRSLINNDQAPDLNSKPDDDQTKALNDPNWEPREKLPSLDDKVAPMAPPADETKGDELPAPGMMAQPATTSPVKK